MSIIENLQWRYATQKFDTSKELSTEQLSTILKAGNLAPTAYGLQPFAMVVVADQAKRDALVEHAYGQEHFAQNSALVILAARTDIDEAYITEYVERTARLRGMDVAALDGFKNMMLGDMNGRGEAGRLAFAQLQAYIALGTMMAAASELRVDNHAMSGFNADAFDEVLGLKAHNLHATVALALGYRSADDAWQNYTKVRKDMKDIVVTI
ncbi:MAG: nitroreductase family protein [Candidatus Paceibacteria bacterium]